MKSASADVARYYEANTESFLTRGQGGAHGAIHRAVWGEGVASRAEAFHYVHGLLRAEIGRLEAGKVLDLGCGTGASLAAVLGGSDAKGYGVTNSASHARLARERMGERATIEELDFCAEPLPGRVDLAYGIESFVHASDAGAFFANVSRSLCPSGRLALCDDFLASESAKEDRWVREFQRGWHAGSLVTPAEADAMAHAHGLEIVDDRDFTPFLELDRLRDRLLGFGVALARPLFGRRLRWMSLSGGHALRQCLKRGLVQYRYRVWEKV